LRTASEKSSDGKLRALRSQLFDRDDVAFDLRADALAVLQQGRRLDLNLADGADLLDECAEGVQRAKV
jgi:hypothetical protein